MQIISVPLHSTTNSYHLDNNREVVNAGGVVQQVTNYYPFGAPYADATASKGVIGWIRCARSIIAQVRMYTVETTLLIWLIMMDVIFGQQMILKK